MNPRRMHQIRNLPEAQRFQVMAEGLVMMHEHIEYLNQDFEVLCEQGRFRSAAILRAFADEEAAKVMILLDVARAGWGNHQRVEKLLKQAIYHHLSRGLYVRVYEGRPASMQEVREFVNPDARKTVSGRAELVRLDFP
jgi:AbiV family abortive infection protein